MSISRNDDLEWIISCGKDHYCFHGNHNDLYIKHKNESAAINPEIYHDAIPLKLMDLLKSDGAVPEHASIEFLK